MPGGFFGLVRSARDLRQDLEFQGKDPSTSHLLALAVSLSA